MFQVLKEMFIDKSFDPSNNSIFRYYYYLHFRNETHAQCNLLKVVQLVRFQIPAVRWWSPWF